MYFKLGFQGPNNRKVIPNTPSYRLEKILDQRPDLK
jgi:hypothetical protein